MARQRRPKSPEADPVQERPSRDRREAALLPMAEPMGELGGRATARCRLLAEPMDVPGGPESLDPAPEYPSLDQPGLWARE